MRPSESVLIAPSIEYGLLAPMLIVFGVGVAGVLIEAFAPRRARYATHLVLSLGGLTAAFVAVIVLATQSDSSGSGRTAVMGAVVIDGPTLFLQGTILLMAMLAVLLVAERGAGGTDGGVDTSGGGVDAFTPRASAVPGSVAEREATRRGVMQTEVFPLTLLAGGGMLLFPASGDLLTMFVALEVLSLPLYLLCGLARRRRLLSQEAALKYFLLGAFSSAFFLFGVALLYGYSGTVSLTGIADAVAGEGVSTAPGGEVLAQIGVGLVAVGLLFKVGAVPFHSWIPDVYQGAPTPITAFMASATKIAAFGALLRVLYVAVPGLDWDWRPVLWVVSILTMVVGAVLAVTQTDIKRMLAYSSVAHTGFLLTGVVADDTAGLSSTMFYLLVYGFTTVGAFAVVGVVRSTSGDGAEAPEIGRWAGLGRTSPVIAGVFALLLLALAGIPLTSGFVGKFAVFQAAAASGASLLVIVGVLCSAIAALFYVRVIVLMFFAAPPADPPRVVVPGAATVVVISVAAAVTVVLGILPQPMLDLADRAASFLQ
ncbi:NADH-quinone oxidoreductase subunit NuoN [Rhodococcus sp. ABRD24]|uniref:NADH-quinone oxidoreductase subunit NuoN n=1 Tax=Rhodococcus sp. ABRD24 TaxID=2507582 RepID=UPI00103DD55B|nr:NADH-quinone oxidoreductase subunit NuoN [Rhodococcus sp. ABRD24]QBJ98138.1 NADH-quinone oxidoreductase subunit NuoN [Rhodococcus sp. ABRD24]